MTKKSTIYDQRAEQMSLPFFNLRTLNFSAGSFRRTEGVQEAVKSVLKDCQRRGLTREIIADEMARLLTEKINVSHLANWAAESKKDYRMPLEWMAAFCIITNDTSVIKAAFSGSGIHILDDAEIAYLEIGKAVEEKREANARLKENQNRLKTLKMLGDLS